MNDATTTTTTTLGGAPPVPKASKKASGTAKSGAKLPKTTDKDKKKKKKHRTTTDAADVSGTPAETEIAEESAAAAPMASTPPPPSPPPPRATKPRLGVDDIVYARTFDTFIVPVAAADVRRGRAKEAAVRLIARKLDGKCGRSGFVRPDSVQVVSLSAGRATHTGDIEFQVHVQYDCCCPMANTLLRAPLCVCTSNNNAAIMGDILDSRGNMVASVLLPREGIVSDAATNNLAFAALLASQNEMGDIQPGDTFGCLVRNCQFELEDPHVTILGQLLSDRVETADERDAAGTMTADDDVDRDDDGRLQIEHWDEFQRIMVINRVDLAALRKQLVAENATRSVGTPFPIRGRGRDAFVCHNTTVLAEYALPDDHTAHITIALQEIPLLATTVTRRNVVTRKNERLPSFLQVWDDAEKGPPLRETLLKYLDQMRRGVPSTVRIGGNTDKRPKDDIVELRYLHQDNYNYRLATTFMPGYAKAIFAHFRAKRILDPCGGWGDRLAGALALREASGDDLAQTYVSFDPNRALRRGYRRIAELFGAELTSDDGTSMHFDNVGVTTHALPFEEGAPELLAADSFDLVFTSPPFFDFEVYSATGPTYGSNWIDLFYKPLMIQSARCVEPGGHVCIHMDDTSAGKIEPFLCETVPLTTSLQLRGRIALRGVLSGKARSVWVFQKVNK